MADVVFIERGVSVDMLHEFLSLASEAGTLTWKARDRRWFKSDRDHKAWNTLYAGKPAFATNNNWGYRRGRIFGKVFLAHRVIWAMSAGSWPDGEIDHINGEKEDNRVGNLRIVTTQENHRNMPIRADNVSGVQGVYWHHARKKWHASICIEGRNKSLGLFAKLEDATYARAKAEAEHGFHVNHGRNKARQANQTPQMGY